MPPPSVLLLLGATSSCRPALGAVLCCAILLAAGGAPARMCAAQGAGALYAGVHAEHNYATQPVLEVAYQPAALGGGRPRLGLSWATTRLATVLGRNELVSDRLLLHAAWHFRPRRLTDPYVAFEFGYTRFGREDPQRFALLDNDAPLVNVRLGLERRVLTQRLGLRASVGYAALQSSTVYPLLVSGGITYRIRGGSRR